MFSLHHLALLFFAGAVIAQVARNDEPYEILAPGLNEVVLTDSTYTIRWTAAASLGTCKITLLIGQSSQALSRLWEIAYGIDFASGSFDWPVGLPTSSTELGKFYGLNITLDSHSELSFMSAPFQVASIDSKGDKPTPISTSSAVGSATGPTQDPASSNTSASSSDQSAQVTSTSSKAESHSSQTSDSSEPTTSIPSSTQPGSGPSLTESVPSQQETSKNQPSSINKGLIAGIATTVVLYVVGLIGLIGFIFYYRRRVLGKMRRLICGKPDKSEIDGRFQKAEMGTQGHGVNVTRRYELDAAREIQEADSRERPAELDSNNAGLDAGAINTEDEILCTGLIAMYQEVER